MEYLASIIGVKLILEAIDLAIRICINANIYDINTERYLKFDKSNLIVQSWAETFTAIDDQYLEIEYSTKSEEERRNMRKECRGRMVGGGFGLTNAVVASLEAGAFNLATGAAHSIFNTIGNAFTKMNASNKKTAIYKSIETIRILENGLRKSINSVCGTLSFSIVNFRDLFFGNLVSTVSFLNFPFPLAAFPTFVSLTWIPERFGAFPPVYALFVYILLSSLGSLLNKVMAA